jgi:PAS domain S-box-containing protein
MKNEYWRILHIDDDEDDHLIVRIMLEKAQRTPVVLDWANTLPEGRRKLKENQYHAVLVDYDMGADTGIELVREFVKSGYPVPMILLTGRGSIDVDIEAMNAGATLYLSKNEINSLLLERMIRYAIERKQAEIKLRLSEEKFSIIFDRSPTPTFLISVPDYRYVNVNQAFLGLTGLEKGFVPGKTSREMGIIHEKEFMRSIVEKLNGQGYARNVETVIYINSGVKRIASLNLELIEMDGGQYILGTAEDITVRKQTEEALIESESRFRDMANNVSQLAWMADETGSIFWYNQRWFDYTGTNLDEVQGWGWTKVHHPEYVERVVEKISRCFASGEFWEDTFPLRSDDGQYRWFLSRAVPIRDEEGRVLRWFGTNTDINEQLTLQEENRQQKDLLERILETIPVGIAFLKGPEHVYYLVNEEYRNYARGKGELIGHTVAEKWPEVAETIIPQMDQVFKTGEPFSITDAPLKIIHDVAPEEEFFSYSFTPIYKADGSIEGVMILAVNTTNEVRDRMLVEAQSARLKAVLESLPVGVWIADKNGSLIGKNKAADQIWAGDAPLLENPDQYQQYNAWFADSGKRLEPEDYPVARALQTGQTIEPTELKIHRFDGTEGSVLVSAAPIKDSEGLVTGAVGINLDNSARKRAEAALRESEHRYRELADVLEIERAKLAAAIEYLPVGIGIADAEGNTLSLNKAGLSLHGFDSKADMFSRLDKYTNEFELRESNGRILPLDEWPAAKALHGEFIKDHELRLYAKNTGKETPVSYSAVPVCNKQGELILIVYLIQDLTERITAIENLEESRTRLQAVINNLGEGVLIVDFEGRVLDLNETAVEILKYPDADEARKRLPEYTEKYELYSLDGSRLPLADWPISRLVGGETFNSIDLRVLNKGTGETELISFNGKPVLSQAGEPLFGVLTFRNITRQKQAEEALQVSENRFRQLAESMPQLVWTAQPDGTVDYYNQRYSAYGGIAPEEGDQWKWIPVLHPDDLDTTVKSWQEAVRKGSIYQVEHRARMADGSFRWHLSRGVPSFDEQGKIVKWFGTATDIHEFKQVQEALRLREERINRLFDDNLIGIISREYSGRILEANDAFLKITGHTREEVETGSLNILDLIPSEYKPADHDCYQELVSNRLCKPFEKEYIRRDGTRVPVLVGYSLIVKEQPELIGFVLDLSELKQAQSALAAYAEKLRQSNEELENFAYIASHDLQEPLRKIMMFGKSLRNHLEGQLKEETEEYLDRMENAASRMQDMIKGLLNLSKISIREELFKPVDLTNLAREVVSDLDLQIQATKGEVIIDHLPEVQGDQIQLRQLLQNLIGNALKFHRDGIPPIVRISGGRIIMDNCPTARIEIEDNGIGFDERNADQIFHPFVRLHGRSKYEGSGIGLAICRKIVERHGGSITASSRPGEGSKFTVMIPLKG